MNYLRYLIAIILATASITTLSSKPLLGHGSKSDCSEECDSYYCPEIIKDDDQKIKKNKSKINT